MTAADLEHPPGPAELEHRAWRCLTGAGRPVTVPELADLAGVTRGGTLRFLTGWVSTGRVRRSAPAGGRYAPYTALFTAAAPQLADSPGQPAPAAAARPRHARRCSSTRRRPGPAAGVLAASHLTPEVPAHV